MNEPSSAVILYVTGAEKFCGVLLAGEMDLPEKLIVGTRPFIEILEGNLTVNEFPLIEPEIFSFKPGLSAALNSTPFSFFSDDKGRLGAELSFLEQLINAQKK
ncbi:MAG TPA: hypothetical protein PKG90_09020 [Chitinophagaceae bacterium]|nr:hypothetical protein [Chitinophagaceae bacterium]HNU13778.1 hypothetical protein [Chitinophagaceae bacterium]